MTDKNQNPDKNQQQPSYDPDNMGAQEGVEGADNDAAD